MKVQLICPKCRSTKLIKRGTAYLKDGPKQRYECRNCGALTTKPTRKGG